VSDIVPPRPDEAGPWTQAGPPLPPQGPSEPRQERPIATWTWWEAVLLYVVGNLFVAQVLVGGLVLVAFGVEQVGSGGADLPTIAASLGADVTFVALMVLYLNARHPAWRRIVGFPSRTRVVREIRWGAIAGLILYPAVLFIGNVVLAPLFRDAFGQEVKAPDQLSSALSVTGKVLAAVLAIGVAPIAEELFFRGILFRSLRDRYGFWVGAFASSLLFGLVHYVPSPWHDALLLESVMVFSGLGFAWIYERRGNLVAGMAAHAIFNAIGIILIFTVG
jgi:CAAX protease family protein